MSVFRGNNSLRSLSRGAVGEAAEVAVCGFLESSGCEILGRNVRVGHLEIDIVARLNNLALIVEVRFRSAEAWTSSFGSVDSGKRKRVRLAGERLWDRKLKHDGRLEHMRFDSASVTLDDAGHFAIEYAPGAL